TMPRLPGGDAGTSFAPPIRGAKICLKGGPFPQQMKSYSMGRSRSRRWTLPWRGVNLERTGTKRKPMALGYETIREIEREEIIRAREIWANNENLRKEQEA